MNVCSKVHGKKHITNLITNGGARGKVSGSPKSVKFIIWVKMNVHKKFHAVHPTVEIFHSGPKWWTDQPDYVY